MNGLSNDDLITLVVFSGLELVCLLVILIASVKIIVAFVRSRRLTHVQGVVVAHQTHQTTMRSADSYGSSHVTLLKPVVRFTAPGGRVIDLLHPIASSAPPPVGSPATVAFDPRDPTQAQVASGLARYFASGVTLVVMTLVLVIFVAVELSVLR